MSRDAGKTPKATSRTQLLLRCQFTSTSLHFACVYRVYRAVLLIFERGYYSLFVKIVDEFKHGK